MKTEQAREIRRGILTAKHAVQDSQCPSWRAPYAIEMYRASLPYLPRYAYETYLIRRGFL